jgi:hypothetical protein
VSKTNVVFILLVSTQLLGPIWTVARSSLHISVLAWLAVAAGGVVLAFITSIVITDLFKDLHPSKKHSE